MAPKEKEPKKATEEEQKQYAKLYSLGNTVLIASGGKTVLVTNADPRPQEKKEEII